MHDAAEQEDNSWPSDETVRKWKEESANPDHYKNAKMECIDAMRAMLGDEGFVAYLRGTIFKYNWRLGRKDASKVEAEKIAVYTRWLNETLAGKELSK